MALCGPGPPSPVGTLLPGSPRPGETEPSPLSCGAGERTAGGCRIPSRGPAHPGPPARPSIPASCFARRAVNALRLGSSTGAGSPVTGGTLRRAEPSGLRGGAAAAAGTRPASCSGKGGRLWAPWPRGCQQGGPSPGPFAEIPPWEICPVLLAAGGGVSGTHRVVVSYRKGCEAAL